MVWWPSPAHLQQAESEVEVNAAHSELHCHPLTVLEVRRILIEHLVDVDMPPPSRLMRLPQTVENRQTIPWSPHGGRGHAPATARDFEQNPNPTPQAGIEAAAFAPPLP